MIVRVVCEDGITDVPITPDTTCFDVVECCRDPGDDICSLVQVWRNYVHAMPQCFENLLAKMKNMIHNKISELNWVNKKVVQVEIGERRKAASNGT
ncbi:hypothetical protein RUM43_011630 [Polyplax serrata]|uniref:Apoptosis-stimulating of p53 protein 2-like RA domain-containing protein n=1 Tax=Polyplax serrata TaxID=468196 RepID=A0AAN8NMD9_POLSC